MNDYPAKIDRAIGRLTSVFSSMDGIDAGLLIGSYGKGEADEYSDLDFYLVVDENRISEIKKYCRKWFDSDPSTIFVEDFDMGNALFFILENGVEGEIILGPLSDLNNQQGKNHRVLFDDHGVMSGLEIKSEDIKFDKEELRRLVYWFWHDLSHFITAIARNHTLWAYGQLEEVRQTVTQLILVNEKQDFEYCFEKVDKRLSPEALHTILKSVFLNNVGDMLKQANHLVEEYRIVAKHVTQRTGIQYPHKLDELFTEKLRVIQID